MLNSEQSPPCIQSPCNRQLELDHIVVNCARTDEIPCNLQNNNVINSHIFPIFNKGIRLACHNVNRLVTSVNSDKLEQLKILLECNKPPVDVYGICESFLNSSISDDFVNVKGFRMVRKDRSYSIGGGLVLYRGGGCYLHVVPLVTSFRRLNTPSTCLPWVASRIGGRRDPGG